MDEYNCKAQIEMNAIVAEQKLTLPLQWMPLDM